MRSKTKDQRPMPKKIPFTQEGLQKVKDRHDLLTKRRPDVLVRLQAAREMGDLSENGAYQAARFELSSLDRELRKLTFLVRMGRVIEKADSNIVNVGNKVVLESNGKSVPFTLVGDYEAEPMQKKLSKKSPFGKAVLGKKVGDEVEVVAPGGVTKYLIAKVE